jgi:hypothetical protein
MRDFGVFQSPQNWGFGGLMWGNDELIPFYGPDRIGKLSQSPIIAIPITIVSK